jgi:hypothetical protein
VLFSGDVWQLPPSGGGFLGDIPHELIENSRKYDPASPVISHGQSLLWSGAKTGVQGVTELTTCERTADEWLRSVQEEFRYGNLQRDTHAFLHGEPTLLPGSVIGKKAMCRNKKCVSRCKDMLEETGLTDSEREELAAETQRLECSVCATERTKRVLVATSPQDPRFLTNKFAAAPGVFPNNDLKYDVNKLRAQDYAAKQGTGIMYCPAKDTPTPEALRIRSDLPAQKVSWLNRHDRESGDLYGVLPLIKGMPMAMSDHIDRNVDKRILRGRVGYVHSWVLADDEELF